MLDQRARPAYTVSGKGKASTNMLVVFELWHVGNTTIRIDLSARSRSESPLGISTWKRHSLKDKPEKSEFPKKDDLL
jgi:hypothetical protein